MKKIMFMLGLGFVMTGTSAFASNNSIHQCLSTQVVGVAYVNQRGFASTMRALRSGCAALENRYEAAEVVWSGSDRAYACVVGSFCQSSGN